MGWNVAKVTKKRPRSHPGTLSSGRIYLTGRFLFEFEM